MTRKDRNNTSDPIIAAALAAGATHRAAGEAAGLSERTVRRRLESPEFAAHVANERTKLVTRVADGLTGLTLEAVETLRSLLSSEVTPAVRCRAAQGILAASRIWRDASEMEDRLQELESLLPVRPDGVEAR